MPRVYLDNFCEVHDILRPYADGDFWQFDQIEIDPGAVYVIGRLEMDRCKTLIREIVDKNLAKIFFSNPAEGSETMLGQFQRLTIQDLAQDGKIMILSGGGLSPHIKYLWYEHFLHRMLNFENNIDAMQSIKDIYGKKNKPYKFLFLNGRMRVHRKYMLASLRLKGLLDQSLWTNLHHNNAHTRKIYLWHEGQNLMEHPEPIHYLPPHYEVEMYAEFINKPTTEPNVKFNLFNNEWGEAYINPAPYIDSYFSLVSETVFDYHYSFRTEKIWKPLLIGHPWMCASNAGFYRDIKNLGFKTFDGIIDESFDNIDDPQARLEKIMTIVENLCKENLDQLIQTCFPIAKYNQQHALEYHRLHIEDFPKRFINFIRNNCNA